MIGIIVTGHNRVATGLVSGMNLIAGEQEKCEIVDYLEEYTPEDLRIAFNQAFENLEDCNGILVFADLEGGLPVKMVSEIASQNEGIEVIAGTNLGMLIEISMARSFVTDLDELVEMAIETGKTQVNHVEIRD